MSPLLTADNMLRAYAYGVFPMAEGRHKDEIYWVDPKRRGIIPLDRFHISKRLARLLRQEFFTIRCDTDFEGLLKGCAAPGPGRHDTWINDQIFQLNLDLFEMGYAHSVECWRNDRLVGGLYGVALGGAFFGESMFSQEANASKIALCHLVMRLKLGGFQLLDTQFVTRHLQQFGAIEIARTEYRKRLSSAVSHPAHFHCELPAGALTGFLQSITRKS